MINELQEKHISLSKPEITDLVMYSITHALIDGCCAAIIAANIASGMTDLDLISFYVILYNTIAFALQVPVGLIVDRLKKPTEAAVLGCLLVLAGMLVHRSVGISLIIAGLGNALFHVGGGAVILNLRQGKASLPGIFVAPGAVGLLIGTLIGKSEYFTPWFFILLLVIAAVVIFTNRKPLTGSSNKAVENTGRFNIVIICILSSIAIRGLVGFMLAYPWKTNLLLLIAFTAAVALGKAFGGIMGDYFGWTRVTLWGLLISAPLLFLGINMPFLAITGVFLFNLTMPITLTITSVMLPGRSGFTFGLTTLALIIGAYPTFTGLRSVLCSNNGVMILGTVLMMALLLKIGLKAFFSESETTNLNNTVNFEAIEK